MFADGWERNCGYRHSVLYFCTCGVSAYCATEPRSGETWLSRVRVEHTKNTSEWSTELENWGCDIAEMPTRCAESILPDGSLGNFLGERTMRTLPASQGWQQCNEAAAAS